jgi:uncharacterized protein YndB with AHSA1/START domain
MPNQIYKSADVKRTSDTTLEVRRSFNAKQDLVFKAFTTPELLKRWMLGPPGWEMPVCEMDLREGGKYRWRWKSISDKSEFGFFGVFKKVAAPQMLSQTQTFDPGTVGGDMGAECLISARFTEENGVTTVTSELKYQCKEDLDKSLATGMTDGMEMSYKQLDNILRA